MLNKNGLDIIDRKGIEELIIEMTYLNQTLKMEIEPMKQDFKKLIATNFSPTELESKIERLTQEVNSINNMANNTSMRINELNKNMLLLEKNFNAKYYNIVNNLSSKLSRIEHGNKFYEKYLPDLKILGSKVSTTVKEHIKQIDWIAIVTAFILGWLINDCNILSLILGQ